MNLAYAVSLICIEYMHRYFIKLVQETCKELILHDKVKSAIILL